MKYTTPLYVLLLLLVTISMRAQNVQNADFDSVYFGGIDRIFSWIPSDLWAGNVSGNTVHGLTPNTHYVAMGLAYHEIFYLTTGIAPGVNPNPFTDLSAVVYSRTNLVDEQGNPYVGFITNGDHFYTDASGYIVFNKGGTPFPYRPTKLIGYYRFEDTLSPIDNFGKVEVLLKKYNAANQQIDTIGYALSTLDLAPTSNWTTFEIPIDYYSSSTPDSVVLVFSATTFGGEPTSLWIDNLAFDFTTPIITPIEPPTIHIYPNPTPSKLQISTSLSQITSIVLADLDGRVLNTFTPRHEIDLSGYRSGVYVLNFYTHNGMVYAVKVVRE